MVHMLTIPSGRSKGWHALAGTRETTRHIACSCLVFLKALPVFLAQPQLRDNSNFFRRGLLELGFNVLGDWDSPVMVRRASRSFG